MVGAAREAFGAIAPATEPAPATLDEAAFEHWIDFCVLRGLVLLYAGGTVDSEQVAASVAASLKIAQCESAEPLVRAYAEHAICIIHNATAQFAPAMERADRARARFGTSGYGRMMVDTTWPSTAPAPLVPPRRPGSAPAAYARAASRVTTAAAP